MLYHTTEFINAYYETHPFTPNSGFTPGTPVFAHYTSARRWYAPLDLAKVNNSEIERVTKMG